MRDSIACNLVLHLQLGGVKMDISGFNQEKAEQLHQEAIVLDDEGNTFEAIEKYLEAIVCDPKKSISYYNVGLIYKYQGEWEKSFAFKQKANALASDDQAVRWNLAIAATALQLDSR